MEEGSDRPMVVAVEARLLKKLDFDKSFTAFDQHKKIIKINDTVRILEGPLEVCHHLKRFWFKSSLLDLKYKQHVVFLSAG